MATYEVTVVVSVEAPSPSAAEGAVAEALDDSGLGASALAVREVASPPDTPRSPSGSECLETYGLDPWTVLEGERLECLIMGGDDEDAREARVTPARGLLCVRWHTASFGVPDTRDRTMETGQFCGGVWRRGEGYKAFYYARKD